MEGAGTEGGPAGRRAALRRWARTHHPDVGGDVTAYVDGVARIEREHDLGRPPVPGRTGHPPLHVVPAAWPVRLSRRLRRRLRARRRSRRSTVL